jgi:hypothetical protein
MKHIGKLFQGERRKFVLGLAFWTAVLLFGWWYYYPALPSFEDAISRITKPQAQRTNIKDRIEARVAGFKILSKVDATSRE